NRFMLKRLVISLNIIVLSLFIVQFFTTPGIVFFLTANEMSLIGKISDLFYMALLFFTPLLTIILLLKYKVK
ncbi:hypothetical protein KKE19_04185, partial [Patescibacteria group bacterium]|nr:hypothetical protein [Patescibacteria group bacterium]MBU4274979.1 hypothetical protein [Patescibacteria group bacterium]MBU4367343.1 hypothetical protein [Patescibacteria group bacterium]MBU4461680.1 hypothetical protein [Patescibacteria group bacterium]MBU4462186.1 hypothetical protein [Patescibacteria group bacterium]